MNLKDLDVHSFVKGTSDGKRAKLLGIAFLCPCCKKEYLTCFFKETSYKEQRELMMGVVSDIDGPTWVPSDAFFAHATANEESLDRITIRPGIDARTAGHALVTVSHGEVSH